tara:strand:+ start:50588 stop:52294 length:1707 start_codon:yes stop_codon:yes gene_type:complete
MSQATNQPDSVTGVQLAQGIGHQPAKGFWAEAFGQVIRRPAAMVGIVWILIVAFFAIFSPLIASGHPIIEWTLNADGSRGEMTSPMIQMLTMADVVLLIWGVWVPLFLVLPSKRFNMGEKLRLACAAGIQLAVMVVVVGGISSWFGARDAADWQRNWEQRDGFPWAASAVIALLGAIPFLAISIFAYASKWRVMFVLAVMLLAFGLGGWKWSPQKETYDYRNQETKLATEAVYTLIPFSPTQRDTSLYNRAPGWTSLKTAWTRFAEAERVRIGQFANLSDEDLAAPINEHTMDMLEKEANKIDKLLSYQVSDVMLDLRTRVNEGELKTLMDLRKAVESTPAPTNVMGTDTVGQDVFSQMLHACRLSISIGFVSTGIAVVIGVTVGALMGYFGGWVDLILYRFVEVFMAIPVLFLLIVAASVLPQNIYVMMAIIGCFTWTGAARFVRAEFMKLRQTDYVQAAQAVGLPLWSILFKHMLPNGVTPVLVDSSFAIAAAILIEAILSYLGLGPANQASWGNLLSNASGETSDFLWWLAIFPGAAIFLTTMAYNLIGEALRDAIDPKLKKARV